MKKLLLIVLLSLGFSNIGQAGFFDNTCDSVVERDEKINAIKKEVDRLRDELKQDKTKVKENTQTSWELHKKLSKIYTEQEKECKELNYQCKACGQWQKLEELSQAREKANRESGKRVMQMLSEF
jgi:septal ring factor EnvC (AmiA/AmiB activator)